MRLFIATSSLVAILAAIGCDGDGGGVGATGETADLSAVRTWAYQLQNVNLAVLGDSGFDLLVMDYSRDGSADGEFTAEEIAALKNSPGGQKIVIAYMDIGEAEDFRFYFEDFQQNFPELLGPQNEQDFGGGIFVRYDRPEWQQNYVPVDGDPPVKSYIDRIIDAGFDGVYLDLILAFESDFAVQEIGGGDIESARDAMIEFIARIANHARQRKPGFLIIAQNAEELANVPGYLDIVDGIGREDVYFRDQDDATTEEERAEAEANLDLFTNAGKIVLAVDYAVQQANVDEAFARAEAKGYIPYVTVVELDRLTISPGHEP